MSRLSFDYINYEAEDPRFASHAMREANRDYDIKFHKIKGQVKKLAQMSNQRFLNI